MPENYLLMCPMAWPPELPLDLSLPLPRLILSINTIPSHKGRVKATKRLPGDSPDSLAARLWAAELVVNRDGGGANFQAFLANGSVDRKTQVRIEQTLESDCPRS